MLRIAWWRVTLDDLEPAGLVREPGRALAASPLKACHLRGERGLAEVNGALRHPRLVRMGQLVELGADSAQCSGRISGVIFHRGQHGHARGFFRPTS